MLNKPSQIIDLIAPSGSFTPNILSEIKEYLEKLNLRARIPENILGTDLLSANDHQTRAQLLQNALLAEDSNFIWCVRGGYGATKLIPSLKELTPPKIKKILMGFSDITALHLFLTQEWGWHTIHGISARQAVTEEVNAESLRLSKQIFEGNFDWHYPVKPMNKNAENLNISGDLTGGNLSIIEAGLGTFWQIKSANKILLLEDANEWTYRLERSLIHLEQCDIFKNIKALVFGNFNHDNSKEEEKIQTMLARFANQQSFPIFKAHFFGHSKENSPWIYGPAQIQNNQLIQAL